MAFLPATWRGFSTTARYCEARVTGPGCETTSSATLRECLHNIKTKSHLNAFISVTETEALLQAEASDQRLKNGGKKSVLDGMVVGVKDNFCMAGHPTTAGSLMLKEYISPFNATAVEKLKDAGAVIVGKTAMDEFGMGSFGTNTPFGTTTSPLQAPTDQEGRSAGGSSSGSAAAVAAGMCTVAIGSDTGGSIRLPASYTGLVGLKPTYGLVSRHGLVAYASSLDCPSVIARNVRDAAAVLETIAGTDPRDATTVGTPPP
eukprot:Colp12_sorted_trinity150504_noHs@18356